MNVEELIAKLQLLDKNTEAEDALAWLRETKPKRTLTFLEAGKAMRIILPILGKPYTAADADQSGRHYGYRLVCWRGVMPSGTRLSLEEIYGDRLKDMNTVDKLIVAGKALTQAGITEFWTTAAGYFSIRMPDTTYVSAFYTSDNPEVWVQKTIVQLKL